MSHTILLVSATQLEIQPTLDWMGITPLLPPGETKTVIGNTVIRIVITGAGMMQAAFHMAEALHRAHADVVLNAGIAGAFDHTFPLGETVWVVSERIGDMGALGPQGFEDIADMGFADKDRFPYRDGWLHANQETDPMHWYLLPLKKAAGLTVNMISGTEEAINRLNTLYPVQIETMEGAAVFYACLYWGVPVYQLRTVSNYVEVLDRTRWDIPLAIKSLNERLIGIFSALQ